MSKKTKHKLEERKSLLVERTASILNIDEAKVPEVLIKHKSTLRLNNLKGYTTDLFEKDFSKELFEKIDWVENAYKIIGEKSSITNSQQFQERKIYVQNASSLLPVLALAPKPKENILNMCAAPGGKLIFTAQLVNNDAYITANDADHLRVGNMKKLCEQYSAQIDSFYSQPAQFLTKHLEPNSFDKVLIDAPCSGEGLIDLDNEKSLNFWSIKKVKRLSKLQKQIIEEGYKLLKPGGTLVYSTCTLSPEENEEVIDNLIQKHEDIKIEEPFEQNQIKQLHAGLEAWKGKVYSKELQKTKRVFPDAYMEAFFVAKIHKSS